MQHKLEDVEYIEYDRSWEEIIDEKVKVFNPVDRKVETKLRDSDVDFEMLETPMFLNSMEENRQLIDDYYHLKFYKKQRKRLDVLVDEDGKPEGVKWSFDPENREKMPEDEEPPEIPRFGSEHVEEAKEYVEENFPDNPGSIEGFFWPTTHEQAEEKLEEFLENRMEKFGKYQDAIDSDLKFGYHSLLSSSINAGLLTPEQVVEKTLEYHEEKDYPMNSLEGFLRQIIGWREFIRAMYELEPEMREANFWDADNSMPEEFYTADTGLPPVDDSIENAQQNAYCHHIERLMVLGNVMLLLEIDPDEVYDWFMEMFIDSYEWVMVPNIYGMSQYAYENMMTKPYISSSNYINKMSHYEGGDWEDHWDGLYWDFISEHEEKISDIQRMSFMTSTFERMNDETVEEHIENAKEFKDNLGLK